MKSALMVAAATACLAMAGVASVQVNAAPTPTAATTASKVDNFQLTDQTLMAYELYYYKYLPAIVVMSRQNGSAYSAAATAELQKLNAAYNGKALFLALDSNLADSRDAIAAEAAKQGVTLPILVDEQQLVGEQLGVQKEGEVFVINPKNWQVAYHGPLDDRFESASPNTKAAPGKAYAKQAVDALIAGQAVQTARVDKLPGKAIAFPDRAKTAQFAQISYAKTIAPIVEE
jgi:hypothetical protein